jgi:ferredoxin
MKRFQNKFTKIIAVLVMGTLFALIGQLYTQKPTDRYIHIRNFRYGKDPWVIRCNRGDRIHLTFSSDDTGHSFFLEEFDIDAKVSPSSEEVTVFKPSDPTANPELTHEVVFTAIHPGLLSFLISKSLYRCHVWCGPMHAFEQGKLVITPNTLLWFSVGTLLGIILLWLIHSLNPVPATPEPNKMKDILSRQGLRKILVSRIPQVVVMILALIMIYIVIITSIFGTKMSGRNLGVLLMWAVWLFMLIAVMTPFGGRVWCTICPLPMFGDLLQRGSLLNPRKGKRREYNNRFSGLFLTWPGFLRNNWLRLLLFLVLITFSTTLVATPSISGLTLLGLLLVPTILSLVFEHRAFCRYICPVTAFVGPFSRMSTIALRNKSQETCDQCNAHFCEKGNLNGWACPYGINVGKLNDSAECGLCLECLRSCTYNNVTVYKRPFGSEKVSLSISDAWLTMAIFSIAIIYSLVYQGPWPVIRDWVNIMDKHNWDLFAKYALGVAALILFILPGLFYAMALMGKKLSGIALSAREVFLRYTGTTLPLGMMLWIAFVLPMLFVNITFIWQSLSDPFGWGWDFFGTAGLPWHQFMPRFIPWFQAAAVLTGLGLSLQHVRNTFAGTTRQKTNDLLAGLPAACFLIAVTAAMLVFFTN